MRFTTRLAHSIIFTLMLGNLALSSKAQSSPVPDKKGSGSVRSKDWIPISAFYDIPVVNADVAVYDSAGKLLFKKRNATNSQGFYPAPVHRVPKDFRLTITWDGAGETDLNRLRSGGFTLSSTVQNFDAGHGAVYVNPVTTLVSRLLTESKSHLTLRQAEARVRQFLGLPPNADLGVALRQNKYFKSRYFSQTEFLFNAEKYGGLESFLNLLVSEMLAQPDRKHSFQPVTGASAQDVVTDLATDMAKAALKAALGDGAGWVMNWFDNGPTEAPPPDATLEAVQNLQQSLEGLQSSVAELQRQLADFQTEINQKLDENEYYTVATPAYGITNVLNAYENDLTYYAMGCGPLFPGNTPPDDNTITYCTAQKQTVLSDFVQANGAYEKLSGYVLDNLDLALSGTIHLFSLSLGESVHLFRPYDSTRVQNAMAYWDNALTEAANLKVEQLHYIDAQDNPGGIQNLTDFLGDPNAPPQNGIFQQTHDTEVKLTLQTVPEGTVIDTKDSMMWATDIPQVQGPCLAASRGDTPPLGTYSYAPQLTPISWNGLSGWMSPSRSEAQNLFYEPSGDPMTWLINQSQSPDSPGFAALPSWDPNSVPFYGPLAFCPGDYFWTRDYAGMTCDYPFCPMYSYYAYEVSTGDFPSSAIAPYSIGVWLYLDRVLDSNERYYWTSSAPAPAMNAKAQLHSP